MKKENRKRCDMMLGLCIDLIFKNWIEKQKKVKEFDYINRHFKSDKTIYESKL